MFHMQKKNEVSTKVRVNSDLVYKDIMLPSFLKKNYLNL